MSFFLRIDRGLLIPELQGFSDPVVVPAFDSGLGVVNSSSCQFTAVTFEGTLQVAGTGFFQTNVKRYFFHFNNRCGRVFLIVVVPSRAPLR